jgi:primosomal protein N' (replication factor Y)
MPHGRASSRDSTHPDRVRVLLPLPLPGVFDYRRPSGLALAPGDVVQVPLGGRQVCGVLWDDAPGDGGVDDDKLKVVSARLDVPPLPAELRRFVDWVARYTLSPPGAVLRMAISVPSAFAPPKPIQAYRRAAPRGAAAKPTPARQRVLAVLEGGPPRTAVDLAREAGCSPSVVKGLIAAGLIEPVALPPPPPFAAPDWRLPGAALSAAQAEAATTLRRAVAAGGYDATLLDGVTGAGKTEVYFAAVAAALQAGGQALVLLPEIALTHEWLDRFARRFGTRPAEWHSDLTPAQRRAAWRAVAEGTARVVVGARSALFLPFAELALIVVDEEHDTAFKQEDGVVYHARDMAVVRAHLAGIPIVLVSATPSLETVVNVEAGRYRRLHLPERHAGAALPAIQVIDIRRDPPPRQRWLTPTLSRAITETLAAEEQAMLFLNRRGYAPLTLCRDCGFRLHCPHCTAWLVEHRLAGRLMCHHCGFATRLPPFCPNCSAADALAACGPGVERLAEEVAALFPEARAAVMTSDTVSGPEGAAAFLGLVREREIDVLIGTQIVAKGHNFPLLTLVGVVDADLGLFGGDLRAAERTYQLLHQVAGRAGRAERPGRVLLQTADPEHPVMRALVSGDRDRFLAEEAAARRRGGMPPFGRLVALVVSGEDADAVDETARALGRAAPHGGGIAVLGPAPAPLAVLRGRHRRRLLMKARRGVAVQAAVRDWLARVRPAAGVRLQVDVDPYGFL